MNPTLSLVPSANKYPALLLTNIRLGGPGASGIMMSESPAQSGYAAAGNAIRDVTHWRRLGTWTAHWQLGVPVSQAAGPRPEMWTAGYKRITWYRETLPFQ